MIEPSTATERRSASDDDGGGGDGGIGRGESRWRVMVGKQRLTARGEEDGREEARRGDIKTRNPNYV